MWAFSKSLMLKPSGAGNEFDHDRQHASDVGVGLLHVTPGLRRASAVVAEVAEFCCAAIELKGGTIGGIAVVEKMERARKNADDVAAFAIER